MFSAVVFIITSYIVYEVDVLARPRIYYQKGVVARMKRSRRVAQGLPIVCGMWKLSSTTAGYVKAGLNPRFIHCLTYAASHWFNELDSTLKTPHLQKFFKIHHHFGNFSALYSHLCGSGDCPFWASVLELEGFLTWPEILSSWSLNYNNKGWLGILLAYVI